MKRLSQRIFEYGLAGLSILSAEKPVSAREASGAQSCSNAVLAKAEFIAQSHREVWQLYPESKKFLVDGMSKNISEFYRINSGLFYREIDRLTPTFDVTYQNLVRQLGFGAVFGDAHLGNLGEFSNKGTVDYAINDYDDATHANRIFDVLRAAVSLSLYISSVDRDKLIANFADGYSDSIAPTFISTDVSNHSGKFDGIDDDVERQPTSPAGSDKIAQSEIASVAGISTADFSKRCKKFEYGPFHGGSSLGIPRFRATCDDVTYEIKGCLGSALGSIKSNEPAGDLNCSTRISELATMLAPEIVGPFAPVNSFSSIPTFKPFGFYSHLRVSDSIDFEKISDQKALKLAYQLGRVIAEGHKKTAPQFSLDESFKSLLIKVLKDVVPKIENVMKDDFHQIPSCL